jgi:hypothetical protein
LVLNEAMSERIDIMPRILKAADRAIAQPNEKEGFVAIGRVLAMLTEHRLLLTSPDGGPSPDVPIHAVAFVCKRHDIRVATAGHPSWCCACGGEIIKGQRIMVHSKVGWTHPECREWWVKVNFEAINRPAPARPRRPPEEPDDDDDIPF